MPSQSNCCEHTHIAVLQQQIFLQSKSENIYLEFFFIHLDHYHIECVIEFENISVILFSPVEKNVFCLHFIWDFIFVVCRRSHDIFVWCMYTDDRKGKKYTQNSYIHTYKRQLNWNWNFTCWLRLLYLTLCARSTHVTHTQTRAHSYMNIFLCACERIQFTGDNISCTAFIWAHKF